LGEIMALSEPVGKYWEVRRESIRTRGYMKGRMDDRKDNYQQMCFRRQIS
jgi:hypothetical protein